MKKDPPKKIPNACQISKRTFSNKIKKNLHKNYKICIAIDICHNTYIVTLKTKAI